MKVTIVGAGLAGCTSARILHDKGHDVCVYETRNHIGGNCYDSYLNNIMVHNYGPHIFHTNSEQMWSFLNRFTGFNIFSHKVLAQTSLGLISIPFNNKTKDAVGDLSPAEIEELIFISYSEKKWGVPWNKIPKTITGKLPTKRNSYDDRLLLDKYQGVPEAGYTKMFERMFEGIPVYLGCSRDRWRDTKKDLVIYTGKLDEYFDYCLGRLPYRSMNFEHITSRKRAHCVINDCTKNVAYTRSTDNSFWLSQNVEQTVITYEYPCDHTTYNEPFYPILFEENIRLKDSYTKLAQAEKNVLFLGRLANYVYLDMADVMETVFTQMARVQ